ncbi:MAG: hypothetical protein JNN01_22750 [Opitutaceae bacterium]|nr:hypothetical protein [Opitutaceae bacterium]
MAQTPEAELAEAVERLLTAGSYTFEERQLPVSSPANTQPPRPRPPTRARGEATIGGFTVADVEGFRVMEFENNLAFLLPDDTWRHSKDMTPDDLQSLRRKSTQSSSPKLLQYSLARHTVVFPHKVLELIVQYGRNVRKVGTTYTGDLPDTEARNLSAYLLRSPARLPPRSSSVGLFRKDDPRTSCSFTVLTSRGAISEVSLEHTMIGLVPGEGGSLEKRTLTTEYNFRLSRIGTTVVQVPPEAEAILRVR